MRQWAEEEVWVKHGDKEMPYRCGRQPVQGVYFDLVDSGRYSQVFATGPSQSGKSTMALDIPMAYVVSELAVNLVAGIPQDDIIDDKLSNLFAMMRRSPRLRALLPKEHRESKGGKLKGKQTLTNGAEIRPMTIGGTDASNAAYTAQWAIITEIKEFGSNTGGSVEPEKLKQIIARMRSFDEEDRRLLCEGTLGSEDDLPYRMRGKDDDEVAISTQTRLVFPCPHCGEWVCPERKQLVGWQDARSSEEAAENARWLCPCCNEAMTDEERRAAMADVRPVHRGQSINKETGEVVGEHPPTRRLYLPYSSVHNVLVHQANAAREEWEASQKQEGSEEHDDAERELCLFVHGVPFKSELAPTERLDKDKVRRRTTRWPRNVCPPDTTKVAVGVDIGDWTCHWGALAGRSTGAAAAVAFGVFSVKQQKHDDAAELLKAAILGFVEEVIEHGFAVDGAAEVWLPDKVWYDGRYHTERVAEAIRDLGGVRQRRHVFAEGAGASQRKAFKKTSGGVYREPPQTGKRVLRIVPGKFYESLNPKRRIRETTFNADAAKLLLAAALDAAKPPGSPGSLSLPRPTDRNELGPLSNHLSNEWLHREWVKGKGLVEEWRKSGQQHWNDAFAMAWMGLVDAGWKPEPQDAAAAASAAKEAIEAAGDGEAVAQAATTSPDWSSLRRPA
ncbi:MAG: phage terminase large subunit family protein [Planctomycetota bacterium]